MKRVRIILELRGNDGDDLPSLLARAANILAALPHDAVDSIIIEEPDAPQV